MSSGWIFRGVIALAVAGALLCIRWQAGTIRDQAAEIGALDAANASFEAALAASLEAGRKADADIAERDKKLAGQRAVNRGLEQRLAEAMNNAQTFTLADPLPDGVRQSLCLRWLAASGRLAADHQNAAASGPERGEAGSAAAFCAAWNAVTFEDALIWAGDLLDHAAELRLDREALQ